MDCKQTLREENICKISHYLLGGLILSPVVVASCAENEITILHSWLCREQTHSCSVQGQLPDDTFSFHKVFFLTLKLCSVVYSMIVDSQSNKHLNVSKPGWAVHFEFSQLLDGLDWTSFQKTKKDILSARNRFVLRWQKRTFCRFFQVTATFWHNNASFDVDNNDLH